jgi:glycosyltransferase involved in cell wall biosynthesis
MKVAQVSSGYYPYNIGGVETVVRKMSEGLARRGFELEVLTQSRSLKLPVTDTINGIIVRRFKTGPLGLDLLPLEGTLRGYLKENSNRYDLIHAHGYHAFSPLYAAWAKARNRLVFNPHYHGIGHNLVMTLLLNPYHHIGKVTFEKADKIMCVSETEKSIIQKHFSVPEAKITVIPNGVDQVTIFQATPFPSDRRLLLYVGRLEKFKNVHLAIQAMAYLSAEYKLMIIGNGSYGRKLLQLIEELHLADKVQILSGLSNEEVYRWYKTCDCVINLSSQEAFGVTVIEGLAAGKPIIVNNKMALAEQAAKLGGVYAVEAETLSFSQLAEQIVRICESEVSLADLSEYSWDTIVERVRLLYQSL